MWVAGIADGARVIVQGQDFVREGQTVEPVAGGRRRRARKVAERKDESVDVADSSTTPSAMRG